MAVGADDEGVDFLGQVGGHRLLLPAPQMQGHLVRAHDDQDQGGQGQGANPPQLAAQGGRRGSGTVRGRLGGWGEVGGRGHGGVAAWVHRRPNRPWIYAAHYLANGQVSMKKRLGPRQADIRAAKSRVPPTGAMRPWMGQASNRFPWAGFHRGTSSKAPK